ncbi:MAG: hypothetical protein COU06_00425 [Candidatus Harrisonbacteria bacterium CG10_big_fil_rev_8_21_14_0_10_38_8]|uniref:RmlD-like substrate binding domain-containing protein n=1 Tax=Candidatus Harrisonbacteria bacterium CG10_big_fil_rev_8_21_14_0_10_38_8 TaxID=1974582 RepID=A0A2M6WKM5_9BACT|nr:MAG: hypothetical protein COU06_00425 [Candidatus Harrisonbacteria bacterium CG10_big_fil_rev_8_21_14_0_10_38_8]
MNLVVLGDKGMLGRAVSRFFSLDSKYDVKTIKAFWDGSPDFANELSKTSPDLIVNCIGKVPQANSSDDYSFVNVELPRFLETLNIPVVHPSTDCEFSGALPVGEFYTKSSLRDPVDAYGRSKAVICEEIESRFENTKVIRTSIVGHELSSNVSFLDWFLSQSTSVNGYTNHYWNGITTLEWARICERLISKWESYPQLNQVGTNKFQSKFDVLSIVKDVYEKDIIINPFEAEKTVNRCLASDFEVPSLNFQLSELKEFFAK